MSTYIIGDVQGCYVELQALLERIDYNPDRDRLGFVGDLVNRGPDSLSVLRFLKSLRSPLIVLGNHDFYLLIIGYGLVSSDLYQHTLHEVLTAPDREELLDWLRHQAIISQIDNTYLVHAGLPPQWGAAESVARADELRLALQGGNFKAYLRTLFGNHPMSWRDDLCGQDRLRYITNAFTRMRFCMQDGTLDFTAQRQADISDTRYKSWFEWRHADGLNQILFGHWASLNGQCESSHCHALDTGCAWGHELTALRLEDYQRFSVPSQINQGVR